MGSALWSFRYVRWPHLPFRVSVTSPNFILKCTRRPHWPDFYFRDDSRNNVAQGCILKLKTRHVNQSLAGWSWNSRCWPKGLAMRWVCFRVIPPSAPQCGTHSFRTSGNLESSPPARFESAPVWEMHQTERFFSSPGIKCPSVCVVMFVRLASWPLWQLSQANCVVQWVWETYLSILTLFTFVRVCKYLTDCPPGSWMGASR